MKHSSGKKGLRRRAQGCLCAAFAAAAACGGCGTMQTPAGGDMHNRDPITLAAPARPQPMPDAIRVFGMVARRFGAGGGADWRAMLQRQETGMRNPGNAKKYAAFLDGFNGYAGEPLIKMARDVNAAVLKAVTYNDKLYGADSGFYWAAPVQTVVAKAGDCKDYATLQYAVLRHLGVPENRLAVALVSASDSRVSPDHVVLLLNTAKAGAAQDFVVLNDGGSVADASLYTRPPGVDGWILPYVFYEAANQDGQWLTSLGKRFYLPAPDRSPFAPPLARTPAPKAP
ncbi:MAG: transglutaminase-like cysteine peptidase [Alphaproteobacteria bacterium]|nr:transglutaminase-like cysteine peptidase [Alphaproteobacteria bacterium]MDE2337423.1 transglutaminase-like cysteine peptidase [Alphaproteobacteria bacterium]